MGVVTAAEVLVTLGVVFLAATLQRISGFGFALIATPLLAFGMSVTSAVILVTLVATPNTFLTFVQHHQYADRPKVKRIAIAATIGMPFGLLIHGRVDDNTLRIALGIAVAAAATLLATGWSIKRQTRRSDVLCGLLSGVLNTSTGTNGPPLVVALQGQGLTPNEFRGTISAIFVLSSPIALALFVAEGLVTSRELRLAVVGIPAMIAGQFLGRVLAKRIPDTRFRSLVIALLFATAAVAIANALR